MAESAGSSSRPSSGRRVVGRVVLVMVLLGLGAATTLGVCWGSAAVTGMERRGVVVRDGDHKGLWVLELRSPLATRVMYFAKGHIYSRPGVGPPSGSSAAVSCWSFASGTRGSTDFPQATDAARERVLSRLQEDTRFLMDPTNLSVTPKCWGAMEETRGWPLKAMASRVEGTMDSASPAVWDARDGIIIQTTQSTQVQSLVGGGGTIAVSASGPLDWIRRQFTTPGAIHLGSMRVLPTRVLWPQFIANTLLFAAAWVVIIVMLRGITRAILARFRTKKGHCPACDYDLTGVAGPVCPECGFATVPHSGHRSAAVGTG
jgi:hypothetical protein